mmetsp:Transcript_782/g.1464  ORF Transcript_782/g.1464 Transcript_782/m.1464 type:complete len:255 (+) Transcript_782:2901-3665(+)
MHIFAGNQMLVHVLLDFRQVTTDDLYQLGGKMLGIQGVDSTQDEVIDNSTHFILNVHHALLLGLSGIWFATTEDGKEHLLAEFFLSPEDSRVSKVHHGIELLQIILHGSSRQEDSSFHWQGIQSPTGLILIVLQSMRLIADQQITAIGELGQTLGMSSKTLVTTNQYIEESGTDKGIQIPLHLFATPLCNGQSLDCVWSQPLDEFIVPILHQTTWTNDNDSLGSGISVGRDSCLEKGVNQGHRLQCLSKSHIIC